MTYVLDGQDAVQAHSRTALRKGSKSFNAAAMLFDPATRDSARLLYAWCRHCDDVIDGQEWGQGQASLGLPAQRLLRLRRQTMSAHAGQPQDDPVFAAFQRVVQRHDIPLALPLALLDGFRMDVEGRRYRTLNDTIDYCYHVAGVVGLMMAHILDVHDDDTLDRACDLGIAFQLTNIARDVAEDWRNHRIYLPTEWLERAGIGVDELGTPHRAQRVAPLVAELLAEAERYYASALVGIEALPFRAGWAIESAQRIYRGIGTKVRSAGIRAWDSRAAVPAREKVAHVAAAWFTALRRSARTRDQVPTRSPLLWSRPR